METFYTYHKEPIYVISIPSYISFKKMIVSNKKKTKNKTSNNFHHFLQLWVNSIVYTYPLLSDKEIFNKIMKIMKNEHTDIEFYILNKIIKKAFTNLKSKNPIYYTKKRYFIFDDKALSEHYNNDNEKIQNYKDKIKLEINKKVEIEKKIVNIKNDIKNYIENGYYKHQILDILLKKYSKDFIYRIIKDYEIKERSRKYIEIDKFIKIALNKSEKYITTKDIIEYLNNCNYYDNNIQKNIKVSERTYYNYLSASSEIKILIQKHNSNYQLKKEKEFMEKKEVKEEVYNEEWTKKDEFELLNKISNINSIDFLDEEEFLENEIKEKNKKIITMKEAEEIENRKVEEWNDDDDEFFNKLNKVKSA